MEGDILILYPHKKSLANQFSLCQDRQNLSTLFHGDKNHPHFICLHNFNRLLHHNSKCSWLKHIWKQKVGSLGIRQWAFIGELRPITGVGWMEVNYHTFSPFFSLFFSVWLLLINVQGLFTRKGYKTFVICDAYLFPYDYMIEVHIFNYGYLFLYGFWIFIFRTMTIS